MLGEQYHYPPENFASAEPTRVGPDRPGGQVDTASGENINPFFGCLACIENRAET